LETAQLTPKDIKALKYRCRPGVILPFFILFTGFGILLGVTYAQHNCFCLIADTNTGLVFGGIVILALLGAYLPTRKYLSDISNGIKEVKIKIIKRKEQIVSHEAGSGHLQFGMEMKACDVYRLIIDNHFYPVEKEFFDKVNEGDKIAFYYAPKSRYLIGLDVLSNKS